MKLNQMTQRDDRPKEETFRCMTCGGEVPSYGPGSTSTFKCPKCRDVFHLDFREECPAMIRMTRHGDRP